MIIGRKVLTRYLKTRWAEQAEASAGKADFSEKLGQVSAKFNRQLSILLGVQGVSRLYVIMEENSNPMTRILKNFMRSAVLLDNLEDLS